MDNREEPTRVIEIDPRWFNYILPGILLLIVLFALVGYTVTPMVNNGKGKQAMTWEDWNVMKKRSEFRNDLSHLKVQADLLTSILTAVPDPVKVQVTTDNVLSELSNVQTSALDGTKLALIDAARTVRSWAMGTATREEARLALDNAIFEIRRAENPGLPTATPIPTKTPIPTMTMTPANTATVTPEPTKRK